MLNYQEIIISEKLWKILIKLIKFNNFKIVITIWSVKCIYGNNLNPTLIKFSVLSWEYHFQVQQI